MFGRNFFWRMVGTAAVIGAAVALAVVAVVQIALYSGLFS
jgi:hypothetical protein